MRPLYDALTDEKFNKQIQFHMPGHLRGRGFDAFNMTAKLDVTELPETDDLHAPEGVLKKSQENAARIFGAKKAYYLVNGSTAGVLSMVLGTIGDKDKIIADRFCHKSFVSALALSGGVPCWIRPEIYPNGTMWGGISPETIKQAIEENPDAKAVYITSPNYFGISSEIGRIAEIVHENNMLLLVDGAHGAHYSMSDKLPPAAISQGADAVCISLHKTLPSLTQTAMLLTNEIYPRVEAALKTVQTSSPSYLFTASCEYAAYFYENCPKERWDNLYTLVKRYFPEQLPDETDAVKLKDFTRINCPIEGNPYEAAEILRKEYNIAVECAYGEGLVAILNVFHTEEEIKTLKNAIDKLKLSPCEKLKIAPMGNLYQKTPREAFFAKKKVVSLKEAEGKISAEGIMVYPPGVYQVLPGEVITKEAVKELSKLLEKGAQIPSVNESNCLIFDE